VFLAKVDLLGEHSEQAVTPSALRANKKSTAAGRCPTGPPGGQHVGCPTREEIISTTGKICDKQGFQHQDKADRTSSPSAPNGDKSQCHMQKNEG